MQVCRCKRHGGREEEGKEGGRVQLTRTTPQDRTCQAAQGGLGLTAAGDQHCADGACVMGKEKGKEEK